MKFKLGHVYSVDYDDHYSTDRTPREYEDGEPAMLRAIGVCSADTGKTVVLEHSVILSDSSPYNKRTCRHGILKSAVVTVRDFGLHDRKRGK